HLLLLLSAITLVYPRELSVAGLDPLPAEKVVAMGRRTPHPEPKKQSRRPIDPGSIASIASFASTSCPQTDDFGLADPANIGHPALFLVSHLPTPNNEESHENPDQHPYQKQLRHKTALCSGQVRPR